MLVVFGITGDLAKVMTFHSLYRLEKRGLLDCPIVGVAVDDWTVDDLRQRARELDRGTAARRSTRRSSTRLADAPLLRLGRLRRHGDLRAGGAKRSRGSQPGLLPGDPAVPVRDGDQGPFRRRPDRRTRGSWSRSRSGTTSPRRGPQRRDTPVHRRVPALPDRPLPRQDGPGRDPLPAVREHDARADLEPQLRRVGADHHGRELRRRGPRPLLRPGRRAARRGRQPPDAGGRARPRWSRRPAATRRR